MEENKIETRHDQIRRTRSNGSDDNEERIVEKRLQRELKAKKKQLQEENSKKYIEYLENLEE
jgi:hypothetical protein